MNLQITNVCGDPDSGGERVKVVPLSGSETKVSCPLCCLMIPYEVESPSPVPSSSLLVEKKGSKILFCIFWSILFPVSAIDKKILSSVFQVLMVTVPPLAGVASAAFIVRLSSTWLI
jgi:hypothetical protein